MWNQSGTRRLIGMRGRWLTLVLLMAAGGCTDSKRASVSGVVNLDGKPLPGGTILFLSEQRWRAKAPIQDGHYQIPLAAGLRADSYRVEVTWEQKTGKKQLLPNLNDPKGPGQEIDEIRESI